MKAPVLDGSEAKVYLVTHSDYDEYSVDSVWSTREQAEARRKVVGVRKWSVEGMWLDPSSAVLRWWGGYSDDAVAE